MRAAVHIAVRLNSASLLLESIGYLQDIAMSNEGSSSGGLQNVVQYLQLITVVLEESAKLAKIRACTEVENRTLAGDTDSAGTVVEDLQTNHENKRRLEIKALQEVVEGDALLGCFFPMMLEMANTSSLHPVCQPAVMLNMVNFM